MHLKLSAMSRTTSSAAPQTAGCDNKQCRQVDATSRRLTDFSIATIISGADKIQRSRSDLKCPSGAQTTNKRRGNTSSGAAPNQLMELLIGNNPARKLIDDSREANGDKMIDLQPQTEAAVANLNHVIKQLKPIKQVKKFRPKNFQCSVCQMAFSNNGQLKNHVRIHTGERPFQCNYPNCLKTFTRNEELTRHKLIHTGIRPHMCTCCGKSFGRKDHLKKHVKTHDEKRKRIRRKLMSKSREVGGQQKQHLDLGTGDSPGAISNCDPQGRWTTAAIQLSSPPPIKHAFCPDTSLMPTAQQRLSVDLIKQYQPNPAVCSTTLFQPQHGFQPALTTTAQSVANFVLSGATAATSAPTNAPIGQMLARDYWRNWYNLIGASFQQQQQQTCSLTTTTTLEAFVNEELFRRL